MGMTPCSGFLRSPEIMLPSNKGFPFSDDSLIFDKWKLHGLFKVLSEQATFLYSHIDSDMWDADSF